MTSMKVIAVLQGILAAAPHSMAQIAKLVDLDPRLLRRSSGADQVVVTQAKYQQQVNRDIHGTENLDDSRRGKQGSAVWIRVQATNA